MGIEPGIEIMRNLFVVFFILLYGVGFAQDKLSDDKRKEFEAQKVAFFTQELDLSPTEAAKFWPLYNEMRKKMRDVEGDMRKKSREIRDSKGMSEEAYKQAIVDMLNREQKMQELKKEYYQKMLQVMPASKLWKLDEAERKFHRQLFERLKREPAPRQK